MQTPISIEIREQIARYVAGETSLEEFRNWFIPNTWNVGQSGDRIAEDLTYETKLNLAEFSNGDWTEEELKEKLRALVDPFTMRIGSPIHSGSSSVSIRSSATVSQWVVS